MFSGPSLGQRENNLMASLGHYYKNEAVAHVMGWQGDLVERQVRLGGGDLDVNCYELTVVLIKFWIFWWVSLLVYHKKDIFFIFKL